MTTPSISPQLLCATPGDTPPGRTATIVIPCLNEEVQLRRTATEIIESARQLLDGFEIILVDDGSTDRTHEIMMELAAEHPECSIIRRPSPMGLAQAFRDGVERARHDYVTLLPGDYAFNISGIALMFSRMGFADMITTYRVNQREARSTLRFIFTILFQWTMVLLFRLPLKDVHSINAYRTARLREIDIVGDGAAFQIEVLVKLFRENPDNLVFIQVPVRLNQDKFANNRTLSFKTFRALLQVVTILWSGSRR